jgi:cytochrome c oxidase cbb3-type subunit 4
METYSLLRHFADSWMLLVLVVFFIAVVLWVFRPGARNAQSAAAMSIFQYDRAPAPEPTSGANAAESPSKESLK